MEEVDERREGVNEREKIIQIMPAQGWWAIHWQKRQGGKVIAIKRPLIGWALIEPVEAYGLEEDETLEECRHIEGLEVDADSTPGLCDFWGDLLGYASDADLGPGWEHEWAEDADKAAELWQKSHAEARGGLLDEAD